MNRRLIGILCGLASSLIWGAFPVVTRLGLTHTSLDSYDITLIRYTVSGLILLPFLLKIGLRGLGVKEIAPLVIGIGSPYMLLVSQGLMSAPVEQFAIVTPGSMIVFSVFISTIILSTRLAKRELIGIACVIVGVGLSGCYSLRVAVDSRLYTYILFVLGGLLWAIYTVCSKRFSVSPLHATALVSVFSMVLYLPVYFAFRGYKIVMAPPRDIILQAVYQGVLVSIVALFFYSKSVQLLGPSIGSTFAALVPGVAMILAAVLLGEIPSLISIIGLLIITGGMFLTLLRRPSPAPDAARSTEIGGTP